jgi:hypothetical protein
MTYPRQSSVEALQALKQNLLHPKHETLAFDVQQSAKLAAYQLFHSDIECVRTDVVSQIMDAHTQHERELARLEGVMAQYVRSALDLLERNLSALGSDDTEDEDDDE